MPGKRWPEEKKREVLEAYALSGNYSAVSYECGVPLRTVCRWCKANPEEIERLRGRNREIAEEAIKQSLEERMADIAEFGLEIREKARQLLRGRMEKLSPGGVASLARAGVEIELKGLGQPEAMILELRGAMLDAAIERELARLSTPEEKGVSNDPSES